MKTSFKKARKFFQKMYLGFRIKLIRDICLGGFVPGGFLAQGVFV